MKDHSKSKKLSSWTLKNFSLKKPLLESGISKTSASDSELPNKPLNRLTLIRNVLSPATYQSEAEFWRVFAFQQKCRERLLCEEITCTTFQSTTDTKRGTETFQCTAHQLSQWRKATLSWLASADHCARLWVSTCLKWFPTKLSVTWESSSCFSDSVQIYLTQLKRILRGLNGRCDWYLGKKRKGKE